MKRAPLLFLNVFVIATCGLIYELLAGTLSSYVLGDSVTQFSLIIGIYLFAMGVGSWLSRFIDKNVAEKFVETLRAVGTLIAGLDGIQRWQWRLVCHLRLTDFLSVHQRGAKQTQKYRQPNGS